MRVLVRGPGAGVRGGDAPDTPGGAGGHWAAAPAPRGGAQGQHSPSGVRESRSWAGRQGWAWAELCQEKHSAAADSGGGRCWGWGEHARGLGGAGVSTPQSRTATAVPPSWVGVAVWLCQQWGVPGGMLQPHAGPGEAEGRQAGKEHRRLLGWMRRVRRDASDVLMSPQTHGPRDLPVPPVGSTGSIHPPRAPAAWAQPGGAAGVGGERGSGTARPKPCIQERRGGEAVLALPPSQPGFRNLPRGIVPKETITSAPGLWPGVVRCHRLCPHPGRGAGPCLGDMKSGWKSVLCACSAATGVVCAHVCACACVRACACLCPGVPGAPAAALPCPAATGGSAGWTMSQPGTGRAPGCPRPARWTTRPSATRRSCSTCRSWTTAAAAAGRTRASPTAPSIAPRRPPARRAGPGRGWFAEPA